MTQHRDQEAQFVLASASPRRADLLRAAGFRFTVEAADVDETQSPGEAPDEYVRRLALAKALAVVERGESRPVLGADTTVVIDGETLGKPDDAADARRMLLRLSGRSHQVLTGVALVDPSRQNAGTAPMSLTDVVATVVTIAALAPDELDWYTRSGEAMGKAGAYAIQGLASRFVTRIDGSYSNVVGLPIAEVRAMCRRLGILVS
jgi:septum formation protein